MFARLLRPPSIALNSTSSVSIAIYLDGDREAQEAFNAWATEQYVVIAKGRWFTTRSFEDARQLAEALSLAM